MNSIGFFAFPGVDELDLGGPWEILAAWSRLFGGPKQAFIVAEKPDPIDCVLGMRIVPHYTFGEVPSIDLLVTPGGVGSAAASENRALVDFVRSVAAKATAVMSVCDGAFILQAAGILEDRRATTHWNRLRDLRKARNVTVVESRFVNDGPLWTSGGLSAGIDCALALVAAYAGVETAAQIQAATEYFPARQRYAELRHFDDRAPAYLKPELAT